MRADRARLAVRQRDAYRQQIAALTAEIRDLKAQCARYEGLVQERDRQLDVLQREMQEAGL